MESIQSGKPPSAPKRVRSQGERVESDRPEPTVAWSERISLRSLSALDAAQQRCERYSHCKSQVQLRRSIIRECRRAEPLPWYRRFCSSESNTGLWIDSPQAKGLVYVAIALNTVFLVLQTYLEEAIPGTDMWVYFAIELTFTLGFVFELGLRLQGSWDTLIFDKWCQYDLLVVLVCFVDVCTLNFIPTANGAHSLILRLLPALQILRLGRLIQELRLIIKGILSAMRAVIFCMGLLFLVIYSCAVLLSSFINTSSHYSQDEFATSLFANLGDSMFTLFTFAALEDFPSTIRHFMNQGWSGACLAIAIVGFILFTNLSVFNLVTAVMVDSIIDVLPKKRTERLAQERAAAVRRLETLFLMMDRDGDRKLTLEEFERGVHSMEEVKHEMTRLQMATVDVKELFMLIDFHDNGKVSVDEFIEGLLRVSPGPATKKELMGVQYDIHRMWNMLGSGQERLQYNIEEGLEIRLKAAEQGVLKAADSVEERLKQHIDASVCELRGLLRETQGAILQAVKSAGHDAALDELISAIAALPTAVVEQHKAEFGSTVASAKLGDLTSATSLDEDLSVAHMLTSPRSGALTMAGAAAGTVAAAGVPSIAIIPPADGECTCLVAPIDGCHLARLSLAPRPHGAADALCQVATLQLGVTAGAAVLPPHVSPAPAPARNLELPLPRSPTFAPPVSTLLPPSAAHEVDEATGRPLSGASSAIPSPSLHSDPAPTPPPQFTVARSPAPGHGSAATFAPTLPVDRGAGLRDAAPLHVDRTAQDETPQRPLHGVGSARVGKTDSGYADGGPPSSSSTIAGTPAELFATPAAGPPVPRKALWAMSDSAKVYMQAWPDRSPRGSCRPNVAAFPGASPSQAEGTFRRARRAGATSDPEGRADFLAALDRLRACVPSTAEEFPKVTQVILLVRERRWSNVPFDKLVLHLDRMGFELSIPEQDRLRSLL